MSNLAGKPPLGQKTGKTGPKPSKALPRQSKKRRAYLASPERTAGKAHMAQVALMECLVCGSWPVEVHHEDKPRSDMNCLPLCFLHHKREYGPGAYHYSPKAFYATHGTSKVLLELVAKLLKERDTKC